MWKLLSCKYLRYYNKVELSNEKNMGKILYNLNEDFDDQLHNGFDGEQHIFVKVVIQSK